jgi:predicted transcriptional regulator
MYGFKQYIDSNPVDSQIIHLYLNRNDISVGEIARLFERSEADIYRVLHAHDIAPNRLKVNHQKVKNLSQLGWDIQEIARFTGYTPRNVRYILAK